jgi:uncharacterized protein
MNRVERPGVSEPRRILPQSGTALFLRRGAVLRVIDPFGGQVADVTAFNAEDLAESLSSGRTIDYANTIRLTRGHVLYSNRSNPMLRIVEDTAGRHDFLLTPCSQQTFEIIYGVTEPHPSCFGNLARELAPFGIAPDAIPTTFNAFMTVDVMPNGDLRIQPPASIEGDHVDFRAEMDLVVGVTACSAELTNAGTFGPIDIEVRPRA